MRRVLSISLLLLAMTSLFAEQSAQNLSGKWILYPEDALFVPRLRHIGRDEVPLEVCDYVIAVKDNDDGLRSFSPRRDEDIAFLLENVMKNELEVKYPDEFFQSIKPIRDPRWLSAYDPNEDIIIVSNHILFASIEKGSAIIHEFGHIIHFKYVEESKLQFLFDRCLQRYKAVGDVEVFAVRDWLNRYGQMTWSAVEWDMISHTQKRLLSVMLFPSVYSSSCLAEWWAEVWVLYNIERERKSGEFVFFKKNPELWEYCEELEDLIESDN